MSDAARPPLCRYDGHTCAACCWGDEVPRPALAAALRRNGRLFGGARAGERPPGRLRLLLHELAARRGLDLLWSVLLWVPGFGPWLRLRLRGRLVCAFAAFEDERERRVGCLLHPTRWGGGDVRQKAAFALLAGLGCGGADFFCLAARLFAVAPWGERQRFARRVRGADWHDYGRMASAYRPYP